MYKVVFDTNIYISSLLIGRQLAQLLEMARKDEFVLFISPDILHENSEVTRKKFGFSLAKTHLLIKKIKCLSTMIYPNQTVNVIPHYPPDNRILECCLEINADYLVTGDKKHLLPLKKFHHTKILTALEFLSIMSS